MRHQLAGVHYSVCSINHALPTIYSLSLFTIIYIYIYIVMVNACRCYVYSFHVCDASNGAVRGLLSSFPVFLELKTKFP